MKRAVLLVNMGGPDNLGEVRPYLRAIFRDPAILPAPSWLRPLLAGLIVSLRASKVQARYRLIGGRSPLLSWTIRQRGAVEKSLREDGLDWEAAIAFRYTSPTIEEAMLALQTQGMDEVVLLPLFPHFTQAMTGSAMQEALRVLPRTTFRMLTCAAWGNHVAILELWSEYLRKSITQAGHDARVLFVAHGIPLRNVRAGEDYPQQVSATARSLAATLPAETEWTLAYQSKVGPIAWTGPYLEDVLTQWCSSAHPLVIMPLSFAADCLETLYDLDRVAAQVAHKAGVCTVVRVPAFNDDPRFARILADLVKEAENVG